MSRSSFTSITEQAWHTYCNAIQYLIMQQNEDGGWHYDQNHMYSDAWTTAEAIITLLYDNFEGYVDKNLLEERCHSGVEWLVRNQHEDGGWESTFYSVENDSAVSSTAYSLIAIDLYMCIYGSQDELIEVTKEAIKWLIDNQTNSGGWNSYAKKDDRAHIGCTAFAVRALIKHANMIGVAEAIQSAVYFIDQSYNSGWNYSPIHNMDATLSNYVLKMLIEIEAYGNHKVDRDRIIETVKKFISIQNQDGTWNDWYGNANSIEATALFVENYCLLVKKISGNRNALMKAIKCLLLEQNKNGSWNQVSGKKGNGLVWVTHYCLLALRSIHFLANNKWPDCVLHLSMNADAFSKSKYRFDVVLSFAGEDRNYVESIGNMLKRKKVRVFYDYDYRNELWGNSLPDKLDEIYRTDAKFCMIFCSQYYSRKKWTILEKRSAQAAQFDSGRYDYILPILLDDTQIPGILKTTGIIDARIVSKEEIVRTFIKKLKDFKE